MSYIHHQKSGVGALVLVRILRPVITIDGDTTAGDMDGLDGMSSLYVKPQVSSWAHPYLKKCDLNRPGWVNQIPLFKGFHLATCGIQPSGSMGGAFNESRAGIHSCPAIRQCSSFPVSLKDRRVYQYIPILDDACCLFSPIIFLLHLWCLLKPPTNHVSFRWLKSSSAKVKWEPPASHCTYDDRASHSSSPPSSQASKLGGCR